MIGKQNPTAPRDLSAIGGDPSRQRGDWKHIGGSPSDDWNNRIAVETMAAAHREPTSARASSSTRPPSTASSASRRRTSWKA